MTYVEAKKAVAGKLIFGDPAQLAARDWLRDFNALKHAVMNCPRQHKTAPLYFYGKPNACRCVIALDAMPFQRAEEMYEELRKYLDFKARQKK